MVLPCKALADNSCKAVFRTKQLMIHHYEEHHQIPIEHQHLRFDTKESYLQWKAEEEKNNSCQFVLNKSTNGSSILYDCHRTGKRRVSEGKRERKLQSKGSAKVETIDLTEDAETIENLIYHCSAHFKLTVMDSKCATTCIYLFIYYVY